MTKPRALCVLIGMILFGSVLLGCFQSGEQEIHFFYEIVCASCDETERMDRLATRLMELRRKDPKLSVEIHDLALESGRAAFERVTSRYRIERDALKLPVLFAGRTIHQGENQIEKQVFAMENAANRENQ